MKYLHIGVLFETVILRSTKLQKSGKFTGLAFSISVAISPGQLHNLILLVIIKSVNFTIAAAAAPTHYKGWIRALDLGFINARISVHEVWRWVGVLRLESGLIGLLLRRGERGWKEVRGR